MPEPATERAAVPPARERGWTFWKDLGVPVLAGFASLAATVLAIVTGLQDASIKRLEIQVKNVQQVTEARRLERADREALNFKLFEAVRTSLASKDANEQRAVAALVTAMADSAFGGSLLAAMSQQGVDAVREELHVQISAAREFDVAQAGAPALTSGGLGPGPGNPIASPVPKPVGKGGWRCDVFWVARGGGAAEQAANRVAARLRHDFPQAEVRVRELPDLVNARSGYRASGFEVRFDTGETALADRVRKALDAEFAAQGRTFVPRQVDSPTPGYLSVFVNP